MRRARNLYGLAAVAMLLSTTPALAGTFCKLATVSGDAISYTFDRIDSDNIWWQSRFTKNGVAYPLTDPKWYAHWRGEYFVVSPADEPDWSLVFGPSPVHLEGLASVTLVRGGRDMGSGACVHTTDEPVVAVTPPVPVYTQPPAPVYTPTPPAGTPEPLPGPARKDSVPIIFFDGGRSAWLDAQVGSESVRFVVDTGATESLIPLTTALRLVAKGEAELLPPRQYRIADGSSVTMERVRIHRFTIGNHVLTDVEAGASNGSPLLGFDVLNMVGKFTIDTRNHEIVFG
jgi:hypothetical protein